jgi:hypothetical protein
MKAQAAPRQIGRAVGDQPLYSRKLHMRVLRASTSCETSLMIFAFSLGESVVNHLASRCRLCISAGRTGGKI